MKRYKHVQDYLDNHPEYFQELLTLRDIVRSTGLVETVKWGAPCYTHNGKNVVGLGA